MNSFLEEYSNQHRRSQELFTQARKLFPSGVNHDGRYVKPFPLYFDRAKGSRIWDVDGNEYIDYAMGMAVHLIGHCPDQVVRAVQVQLEQAWNFGLCHMKEMELAELVMRLFPSIERIRFCASGTEATLQACHIARAYTGKQKIVRFEGHYHGWHDFVMPGLYPPYDDTASLGLSGWENTIVLPANEPDRVEQVLSSDSDIAGVIIEATGLSWGTVPLNKGFLQQLRDLTNRYKVVFIMDEIISGFRWSPGGIQELVGVTPDITTLGKILTGGLPGSAVGGKAEVLDVMEYKDDPERDRFGHIYHGGTFNANPIVATAGVEMLKIIATGEPQKRANEVAAKLRAGFGEVIESKGVNAFVYGEASAVHTFFGARSMAEVVPATELKSIPKHVMDAFRTNLQMHGVNLMSRSSCVTSSAHTDEEVAQTIQAFDGALADMLAQRVV